MHFYIPQPEGTTLDVKLSIPRLHQAAVPRFYQVVRNIYLISHRNRLVWIVVLKSETLNAAIELSLEHKISIQLQYCNYHGSTEMLAHSSSMLSVSTIPRFSLSPLGRLNKIEFLCWHHGC